MQWRERDRLPVVAIGLSMLVLSGNISICNGLAVESNGSGTSDCARAWKQLEGELDAWYAEHTAMPAFRRRIALLIRDCAGYRSELETANVVETFYGKYLEAMRAKYAVHLLHISKAGGTTMCNVAKKAGCRVREKKNGTCWCVECLDGPRWMEPEKEEKRFRDRYWVDTLEHRSASFASCGARAQMMLSQGLTLFANENFLLGGMRSSTRVEVCRQFLNVVVLRDPIQRVVSHLFELGKGHYLQDPEPFEVVQRNYPRVLDNYMLRSLLGGDAFRRPAGALTKADLQAGIEILESFDVVMTTDHLAMPERRTAYLQRAIGWKFDDNSSSFRGRTRGWGANSTAYSSDQMLAFREMNTLDQRLFERATELADLDAVVFAKVQDSTARNRASSSACERPCGHVCHQSAGR